MDSLRVASPFLCPAHLVCRPGVIEWWRMAMARQSWFPAVWTDSYCLCPVSVDSTEGNQNSQAYAARQCPQPSRNCPHRPWVCCDHQKKGQWVACLGWKTFVLRTDIILFPLWSAASEFNRQKGSIYLVFDFMDHDLGGLLNRGVDFTQPEIMCLTKQLLQGVHYMHKQNILHRDMKVANLLLNKFGVLKIADFGLARATSKDIRYTPTVCTVS